MIPRGFNDVWPLNPDNPPDPDCDCDADSLIGCADAGSASGWHSPIRMVRFLRQHTLCDSEFDKGCFSSSIQLRRRPAGLDHQKEKANSINALGRTGGAVQSARLMDGETSKK
jgi:hypothetical protein